MTGRRVVLVSTCATVAVLAVLFLVLARDTANVLANVISALAGVAAIGVGVWAVFHQQSGSAAVRVSRTGPATSGRSGTAVSGFRGPSGGLPAGGVVIEDTASADASEGGDAVSGADLS
jgi:hypothetical protein